MKGDDRIDKKKQKLLIIGIVFFVLMIASAIFALTEETTEGVISSGYVDIKIQPMETYDDTVVPGENIELSPKVENLGADCYLRIKISYINQDTDFTEYISGFNTDFEKHGDYYYYKDVFKSKDVIELFNLVSIPANVESMIDGKVFNLEIVAEAIQEKNFEPDYSSDKPWKDNVPTVSVNNLYNITDYSKISIGYEDNTNEDIKVPSGFFAEVKSAMPGDTYADSITLSNSNKSKAKYYMTIGTNNDNQKDINLLKNIKLIITNSKGETIYDGSLIGEGKILLGEYDINDKDKFDFKISFPAELGNEFENLNPNLFLIFSAEYENAEETNKSIKTGDKIDLSIVLFIISSICFIFVCFKYYKERNSI